ncbi:hypothetical protein K1719_011302 [Acacia pycnantha]|nr:hypothetical protein K1719_011302 [Acacia pycnantha]
MGESEGERERSGQGDGDGRGQGDGDGREREDGGGTRHHPGSESLSGGMSFSVGSGGNEKGLGFLVSHDEEDDIVSGWRGFFAKQNVAMENADREKEECREEAVGNAPPSQYPVLSMTEEQYTSWCRPWMNSLIIKVLGLSVPKHVLFDRVRRMWKPQQPLKVVPLNNGYYIVSFSNKEDRDYAFSEGPWMIDDHYLLVQRWRPNFNPWKADCQKKIAVWIRIPDLPLEFCTVESLGLIGNMIGRIVKIDRSTSIYEKGGFARICVEIDLQTPLLPAFKVFGEERQLVYEGLHLVCFGCGKYGHERMVCPDRSTCDDTPDVATGCNVNGGHSNHTTTVGDKSATSQGTTAEVDNHGSGGKSQPGGCRDQARKNHEIWRKVGRWKLESWSRLGGWGRRRRMTDLMEVGSMCAVRCRSHNVPARFLR